MGTHAPILHLSRASTWDASTTTLGRGHESQMIRASIVDVAPARRRGWERRSHGSRWRVPHDAPTHPPRLARVSRMTRARIARMRARVRPSRGSTRWMGARVSWDASRRPAGWEHACRGTRARMPRHAGASHVLPARAHGRCASGYRASRDARRSMGRAKFTLSLPSLPHPQSGSALPV
jgi:hypothetical protein